MPVLHDMAIGDVMIDENGRAVMNGPGEVLLSSATSRGCCCCVDPDVADERCPICGPTKHYTRPGFVASISFSLCPCVNTLPNLLTTMTAFSFEPNLKYAGGCTWRSLRVGGVTIQTSLICVAPISTAQEDVTTELILSAGSARFRCFTPNRTLIDITQPMVNECDPCGKTYSFVVSPTPGACAPLIGPLIRVFGATVTPDNCPILEPEVACVTCCGGEYPENGSDNATPSVISVQVSGIPQNGSVSGVPSVRYQVDDCPTSPPCPSTNECSICETFDVEWDLNFDPNQIYDFDIQEVQPCGRYVIVEEAGELSITDSVTGIPTIFKHLKLEIFFGTGGIAVISLSNSAPPEPDGGSENVEILFFTGITFRTPAICGTSPPGEGCFTRNEGTATLDSALRCRQIAFARSSDPTRALCCDREASAFPTIFHPIANMTMTGYVD